MKKNYETIIIGGGIIGIMVHYQMLKKEFKNILQIEKNNYLASETTGGNSGVLHGGFDAEHPIEAKLNIVGTNIWKNDILPKFPEIPRKKVSSLIVAFNDEEIIEVNKLYDRGIKNNLDPKDIKIIGYNELLELEPRLNKKAVGALLCTSSMVIDPVIATREIARKIKKNSNIIVSSKVISIKFKNNLYTVTTNKGDVFFAKNIINAAGHHSANIGRMANESDIKLKTKRGEYRVLAKEETCKVKNIVFKIPSIHGKGVIVAPLLDGRTLVGPTAEDGVSINDTRLVTEEKYKEIGKIGSFLIPSLDINRTEKTYAGSRSIYPITNDFYIDYGKNKQWIDLHGIKSPGLSSAPAIAFEVIKLLKNV